MVFVEFWEHKVAHATAESEYKTLPDKNAVEEVILCVSADQLMEVRKEGGWHPADQGRAKDFRQRDAIRRYAQEDHHCAGNDAGHQPGQKSGVEALPR